MLQARTDRWAARGLAALLLLAPWPFGSVVVWAWAALALAAGLLTLAGMGLPAGTPSRALRLAALCYAAVILWTVFQASTLAPSDWHHPAWPASGLATEGSISVDRERTRAAILQLLAYAAIFGLACRLSRDRQQAYVLIRAIGQAGLLVAVYALVLEQAGIEKVLWLDKTQHLGVATGSFINRNNLATYANLSLLCWLALFIRAQCRATPAPTWRAWFVSLVEHPDLGQLWRLAAAVVVLTASLATGSRGGLLSLALAGVIGLVLAILQHRRRPATVAALVLAGALAGLYVGSVGNQALERLAGLEGDARSFAWTATVQAIADRPWLGTGLGTYQEAFRPYRPPEVPTAFDHAHNDFLELALGLGLPAAILLGLALAIPTALCFAALFRTGPKPTLPFLGVLASILVLAHSLVDFGLHIPAVAATYAALLGIGTGRALATASRP